MHSLELPGPLEEVGLESVSPLLRGSCFNWPAAAILNRLETEIAGHKHFAAIPEQPLC
jgi:hypothetical protein